VTECPPGGGGRLPRRPSPSGEKPSGIECHLILNPPLLFGWMLQMRCPPRWCKDLEWGWLTFSKMVDEYGASKRWGLGGVPLRPRQYDLLLAHRHVLKHHLNALSLLFCALLHSQRCPQTRLLTMHEYLSQSLGTRYGVWESQRRAHYFLAPHLSTSFVLVLKN